MKVLHWCTYALDTYYNYSLKCVINNVYCRHVP